ncbi:MAG: VWA domain-containing protein, partial [Bacteroidales bacterium]|nr:VWA domain-containing protein [Bacteroidales bacterium]
LFVVDATGSMTDEIDYLKSELLDVINRVEDMNNELSLRIGSVFYRDEGDEYLTRVSPFSTNLNATLSFINDQHADGGGDYEEAVHTALNTAITQLSWSKNARARLLFLLLDAPPHLTLSIVSDLNNIIKTTAEKGIKIIPISASGINKDTEFLFRFFATATNGTYVFITNDSGIGGDHIEATVGDYEVELLNDLIVRLIAKYTE